MFPIKDIAVIQKGNDTEISGLENYLISQIFDCGQTFRFDPDERGDICGIARGRYLRLSQPSPDRIILHDTTAEEFESVWRDYLAIDDDYAAIRERIAQACPNDSVMKNAMECGSGIRILHQDPWETLCSFIISQNNNIPRIKGIIARLSRSFGVCIDRGRDLWSFPTAQSLLDAGTDRIFACGTGFRAKYITDACEKILSGAVDLDRVLASDTASAAEQLCSIKGVGPKVAACSLLFGFGKTDAFPIDVWVGRVLAKYYPKGFDHTAYGSYAGLVQQYLFFYERWSVSRGEAPAS